MSDENLDVRGIKTSKEIEGDYGAVKIFSPILSLSIQRRLSQNSRAIARSFDRLASGLRINSARDDASGLARSNGLERQIRALRQVDLGLNHSYGFLMTAEGALRTQLDLVGRMRELSVQAANEIYTNDERSFINQEFQELMAEYDRLASSANFNQVRLLDGSFGTKTILVGSQANQKISVSLSNSQATSLFEIEKADGTFSSATTYSTTSSASFQLDGGDIDGDGDIDLVTSDGSNGLVHIFSNNGDGTYAVSKTYSDGTDSDDIRLFDVDGDLDLDLVTTAQVGSFQLSVRLNNGSGVFGTQSLVASGQRGLEAGDFNNDGKLDIVSMGSGLLDIHLGNGNGTFQSARTLSAGTTPQAVQIADINGDGSSDIIATDNTASAPINIYLGNGNGTFQSVRTVSNLGFSSYDLSLDDIDNDGDYDIVASNQSNGFYTVHLGNGNGTFAAARTFGVSGTDTKNLKLVDVNEDGYLDIIGGNTHYDAIDILLGNGVGGFTLATTVATGDNPRGLYVNDLDGDGINDIASISLNSSQLSIHLGETADRQISSISDLSITSTLDASRLLDTLDNVRDQLLEKITDIGALVNRFDSIRNGNSNQIQALESSRSAIRDADLAEEVAEITRLQILEKAGVSLLAQSMVSTKLVLELITNSITR